MLGWINRRHIAVTAPFYVKIKKGNSSNFEVGPFLNVLVMVCLRRYVTASYTISD